MRLRVFSGNRIECAKALLVFGLNALLFAPGEAGAGIRIAPSQSFPCLAALDHAKSETILAKFATPEKLLGSLVGLESKLSPYAPKQGAIQPITIFGLDSQLDRGSVRRKKDAILAQSHALRSHVRGGGSSSDVETYGFSVSGKDAIEEEWRRLDEILSEYRKLGTRGLASPFGPLVQPLAALGLGIGLGATSQVMNGGSMGIHQMILFAVLGDLLSSRFLAADFSYSSQKSRFNEELALLESRPERVSYRSRGVKVLPTTLRAVKNDGGRGANPIIRSVVFGQQSFMDAPPVTHILLGLIQAAQRPQNNLIRDMIEAPWVVWDEALFKDPSGQPTWISVVRVFKRRPWAKTVPSPDTAPVPTGQVSESR